MKRKNLYLIGILSVLIAGCIWMQFGTKTAEVRVVAADCGDISEIGSFTELLHPATVDLTNQSNGRSFTLRFPSVFLGADMPVYDSAAKNVETWQSSQFCGDRGLFGYTDLVQSSDSLRVTYNHFGKIISWQLVD
ncbi:MAG: hypothetical protein WAZ14_03875 [Patescibacteria group bacterium]